MNRTATPPARSVLVTGASGLVGRQVIARVARLAQAGGPVGSVVAFDLRDPPASARVAGVEYVAGDIRDPALEKALSIHHVNTVVHLAAVVTPGPDSSRELEYSIDVLGTENVIDCALRAGVDHLVYTSSGAAYGYHADSPTPLREDDALRGNEEFAYAHHKRLVEELLARQRHEHPELRQLILRPGTILGETVSNPITDIFERPVVIGVAGSDSPFVIVWDTDVADCILMGIREVRTGIYNLCGDGSISLREIARRLGKPYVALPASVLRAGLAVLNALGATRLGPEQVRFLAHRPVLCNLRLKSELGFTPSLTSAECFERYRRHRQVRAGAG